MNKLRDLWELEYKEYQTLTPGKEFGVLIIDGIPYACDYISYGLVGNTGMGKIYATDGRYRVAFYPAEEHGRTVYRDDALTIEPIPEEARGKWIVGEHCL